jgi:hypothetical protein
VVEGSAAAVENEGLGLYHEAAFAVDQVGVTAETLLLGDQEVAAPAGGRAPEGGGVHGRARLREEGAYIRWNVVGKKGTELELSMYQDGAGLIVDSKPLLAFVLGLSGGTAPKGKHPRVKWSYAASLDNALDDATNLREQLEVAHQRQRAAPLLGRCGALVTSGTRRSRRGLG